MKKLIIFILSFVLLWACFDFQTAAADGQYLTVHYTDEGEALQDVRFHIYRLGDVNGNKIIPDSVFSFYSVDFDISTAEKQSSLAHTLSAYILRDDIIPLSSDTTDIYGNADFDSFGFESGAYIVMADKHRQSDCTYFCEPVIVVLPYGEEDRVTLNPKFVSVPDDTETISVSYRVLKSWLDENGEKRPVEIEVELLRDGEIYDTVVLDEENNWRYQWDNLSVFYHWTVTEKRVEGGYVVSLSQYGKILLLTNSVYESYGEKPDVPEETTTAPTQTTNLEEATKPGETTNPEETTKLGETTQPTKPTQTTKPGTTEPDDTEKEPQLPQTGSLRWPVPYLALIGVFLLIVGYAKYRKSEFADE